MSDPSAVLPTDARGSPCWPEVLRVARGFWNANASDPDDKTYQLREIEEWGRAAGIFPEALSRIDSMRALARAVRAGGDGSLFVQVTNLLGASDGGWLATDRWRRRTRAFEVLR